MELSNSMRRLVLAVALVAPGLSLSGCATLSTPLALTPDQSSEVERAQDYLNTLTAFQAHFTQSGWSGGGAGVVWVDRPGRLRLSYFGPDAKDMTADHGLFVVYDHANGATTTMPVAKTPLGLLLAPRITLSGEVAVTGFKDDPAGLALTLQDQTHPDQGTLTVMLQKAPLLLLGVTATDVHGRSLTLLLTHLDLHPVITPELFRLPSSAAGT
jgi:outer membrane lipoprotein-sorting protein